MIRGVGIDQVAIERIRGVMARHEDHFLERLFTPKEIAYCKSKADPAQHFAGRFAAKEAISKALGCGFGKKLAWHDLEVLPDASGRPTVKAPKHFGGEIHLSITHTQDLAASVAVWI